MKKLQEDIFVKTENLVARFNLLRVTVLALISALVILIFLWAFMGTVPWQYIVLVIGISFIYSLVRDYFMAKYSRKVLREYHQYLLSKKPGVSLYIPMFSKTRQGMILKKAALYFDRNELYMEAFNQKKAGNKPSDSITIKHGRDFGIDIYHTDSDKLFVTYQARLMDTEYDFSIVNIKELLDMIEQAKGAVKQ